MLVTPAKYQLRIMEAKFEAMHNDSTSWDSTVEIAMWCQGRAVKNDWAHGSHIVLGDGSIVRSGWWAIKGPTGEFSTISPELFALLFEEDPDA